MASTIEREALLRKIRALRSKSVANGCTEAEAAGAAAKLAELIAEHHVSDDELSLRRDARGCVKDSLRVIRKERPEWFACAVAVSTLFKVKVWSSQSLEDVMDLGSLDFIQAINFYGFPEDVEASVALIDIIANSVNTEGLAFSKTKAKGLGRGAMASFEMGMTQRLSERILEIHASRQAPTGRGLIVLKDSLVTDEFAQYCREQDLNLRSAGAGARPTNMAGYAHGQEAGNRVNLQPGPAIRQAPLSIR